MPFAVGSLNPGASAFPQLAAGLANDQDKMFPADRSSLQFAAGSFNAGPEVLMPPRDRPAIPLAPMFL